MKISATSDENKRSWIGKTVYWNTKTGWTPNQREAWIIDLDEDGMSHVPAMIAVMQQASKYTQEIDEDTLKFSKLSVKLEAIDWNEGDLLQERQYIALKKLSLDDIEALGLKSIAAFHKLRK